MHLWLQTIRVYQWHKNGLLFAGLIFAGHLRKGWSEVGDDVGRTLLGFVAFCLLSSAIYLFNDLKDRESDRLHPEKRHRPIASGVVSPSAALCAAFLLLVISFTLASWVSWWNRQVWFLASALGYLGLTLSYTFFFKHRVIADVMVLALGFVVRIVAGCAAVPVPPSEWIIFCVFNLALFMACCKRRHELLMMGDNAEATRSVLPHYSPQLLDIMVGASATMTIIGYALYTFLAPHVVFLGQQDAPWLMVTILNVIFGVFRFLFLAYRRDIGGKPEQLWRDPATMLNALIWMLLMIFFSLLPNILR
ncbi:MAG: UbiA prenyltransferase family protein [Abditibacteriales bacterium]|nr:UbiA prenyltransferase family protein [Abditibacteriales bacterium]